MSPRPVSLHITTYSEKHATMPIICIDQGDSHWQGWGWRCDMSQGGDEQDRPNQCAALCPYHSKNMAIGPLRPVGRHLSPSESLVVHGEESTSLKPNNNRITHANVFSSIVFWTFVDAVPLCRSMKKQPRHVLRPARMVLSRPSLVAGIRRYEHCQMPILGSLHSRK